ncbi:MAG: hypothetical protein CJBNEKGG_04260 [Prosthecobacter sp.]|nr:hypothetical protein [Prosthecobacter sp.]
MVSDNSWHRPGVISMIVSEHDGGDLGRSPSFDKPINDRATPPADIKQDEASVRKGDDSAVGLADIPKIDCQFGCCAHAAVRIVILSIETALLLSPSFT